LPCAVGLAYVTDATGAKQRQPPEPQQNAARSHGVAGKT
jgi:hypothetical protein